MSKFGYASANALSGASVSDNGQNANTTQSVSGGFWSKVGDFLFGDE